MTRPMYQVPKPRKYASKKVIDTPIAKRKKVVLNFVQREEIITKKKNGYCPKKLALDYMVGLSTIYDIIAKGSAELSKFRTNRVIRKIYYPDDFEKKNSNLIPDNRLLTV
ncbi:hypothetical protein BpHYR1_050976 [Brachionus plicatilis]|uniref:HTH psq-type domain-containing protein n=1 Tax=Brachionus plicatilis TaxID=10195 RepID=A0A3M7QXZ7_BRAPC|nr:hypothetical protein BpHYR1_050976 [Brachionus plicatilis]